MAGHSLLTEEFARVERDAYAFDLAVSQVHPVRRRYRRGVVYIQFETSQYMAALAASASVIAVPAVSIGPRKVASSARNVRYTGLCMRNRGISPT
jgi:hypothetical protein